MKIFTAGLILISTCLFAQQQPVLSILELENQISDSTENINYSNTSLNTSHLKKSTGLAILYSLLLPGMGELYAGNYSSGKYFTIAEGALWATFIGMNIYAGNQKDNYQAYATVNASVNIEIALEKSVLFL